MPKQYILYTVGIQGPKCILFGYMDPAGGVVTEFRV